MKIALAGDTMLGRGVAAELAAGRQLFDDRVKEIISACDRFILNLECCISDRGERWPDPGKPFFFRAPPSAVATLVDLGVDCVTLANNHALDYGPQALSDTIDLLHRAGIRTVGAGRDEEEAREPATLPIGDERLTVVACTDHPSDFAAGDGPGVAYVHLRSGSVPEWLTDLVGLHAARGAAVVASPHWGPNMVASPLPYVRAAAAALRQAGATVVAGHSAHVFHGVDGPILYDLGDFIDDYAIDPRLRNDLGLLWLLELDQTGVAGLEAVPLRLSYAYTGVADETDTAWIVARLGSACAEFGTAVELRAPDRIAIAAT